MSKSSMPNLPGVGAVTDTLEFMKSLWGGVKLPGASLPGMVMPSLSVEEINQQIADLKAVENWLTVNMNMLHGTIKALEVQSATIATLQSMSANFSAAMKPPAAAKSAPAEAEAPPFETPFKAAAQVPEAREPASSSASAQTPDGADPAAPVVNPAAWWTMLQDQFKQAVANATVPLATAATVTKAAKVAKPMRAATKVTKPSVAPKRKPARKA